jgi:hypothetical protein
MCTTSSSLTLRADARDDAARPRPGRSFRMCSSESGPPTEGPSCRPRYADRRQDPGADVPPADVPPAPRLQVLLEVSLSAPGSDPLKTYLDDRKSKVYTWVPKARPAFRPGRRSDGAADHDRGGLPRTFRAWRRCHHLRKRHPSSRTGENPPYGMIGGIEETSASFEARSAPRSYPTWGTEGSNPSPSSRESGEIVGSATLAGNVTMPRGSVLTREPLQISPPQGSVRPEMRPRLQSWRRGGPGSPRSPVFHRAFSPTQAVKR